MLSAVLVAINEATMVGNEQQKELTTPSKMSRRLRPSP